MLFLVPLLAGFLRPVTVSVEKANDTLENVQQKKQAVEDVARGAKALLNIGGRVREQLLGSVGDEDEALSSSTKADSSGSSWNIGIPLLPRPWAMAFTAALLILLADTIFQVWCPHIVKSARLDDFVDSRCQQFATHPSRDALIEARRTAEDQPDTEELLQLEQSFTKGLNNTDGANGDFVLGELNQVRMNLIQVASRADYLRHAIRSRPAAWLCFIIYTIAACIVLRILQEQTLNVLRSAGWWTT